MKISDLGFMFIVPFLALVAQAVVIAGVRQPEDSATAEREGEVNLAASEVYQGPAAQVKIEAENAAKAANTAKQAATVANKVAEHSVSVTKKAKSALSHALGALHDARVESAGLNSNQKHSLKKAEAKLREATKKAEFGKLKKVEEGDIQKGKMQEELEAKGKGKKESELGQMRTEIRELRRKLKEEKGGDAEADKELMELEKELARKEKEGKTDENDETKAEIERLRQQIDKMEDAEEVHTRPSHPIPGEGQNGQAGKKDDKELMNDVKMKPLGADGKPAGSAAKPVGIGGGVGGVGNGDASPVESKGIDIDTQMPYGDLEPFGREDTAQELTENSVKESDEMVDQLERAEVAEEKRAVFRALTRLRGAAITSFDGVARSQTGNIDEYNKVHKWRNAHPMHHLADEESDVTKWAFPDNADFIQKNKTARTL